MTKREKPSLTYGNLGTLFESLGEYDKAKEYIEKALPVIIQIDDKHGEASSYEILGVCLNVLVNMTKL